MTRLTQGSLILALVIFYSGERQSLCQGELLLVLCCCGYQKDKFCNWAQERFHCTAPHYLHLDLFLLDCHRSLWLLKLCRWAGYFTLTTRSIASALPNQSTLLESLLSLQLMETLITRVADEESRRLSPSESSNGPPSVCSGMFQWAPPLARILPQRYP